mmetsp:Transcript_47480/g.122926  ORF Transcript_47480/g.122926 Transcript_47480/m.122926 type:complete len:260 (+) Transcript_47480:809-1588(+)
MHKAIKADTELSSRFFLSVCLCTRFLVYSPFLPFLPGVWGKTVCETATILLFGTVTDVAPIMHPSIEKGKEKKKKERRKRKRKRKKRDKRGKTFHSSPPEGIFTPPPTSRHLILFFLVTSPSSSFSVGPTSNKNTSLFSCVTTCRGPPPPRTAFFSLFGVEDHEKEKGNNTDDVNNILPILFANTPSHPTSPPGPPVRFIHVSVAFPKHIRRFRSSIYVLSLGTTKMGQTSACTSTLFSCLSGSPFGIVPSPSVETKGR